MKNDIRSKMRAQSASERSRANLQRPLSPHISEMPPAPGERNADAAPLSQRRRLTPSEFNTAIVHFYRGEVQRANTWRNRLDTTTNWAVLTAGATLSFAFSSPANPHFVILINTLLISFFLFMEARRYRYYEIWSSRVRRIETGYFSQILMPERAVEEKWVQELSDDLITPHFTISEWEAVGRRLRRNYLWIFALLAASWNLKVYMHPYQAINFVDFINRARVGVIPGEVVVTVGIIFNVVIVVFALMTLRLREATGEVLPQHEFPTLRRMTDWTRTANRRSSIVLRRAKRARVRARQTRATSGASTNTGEWKRPERKPAIEEELPEGTLR